MADLTPLSRAYAALGAATNIGGTSHNRDWHRGRAVVVAIRDLATRDREAHAALIAAVWSGRTT